MNPADAPLSAGKHRMWELRVKFYWGHSGGYSLGDSISESSEELPYRGRAGVSINMILVSGNRPNQYIYIFQKAAANKEQTSP